MSDSMLCFSDLFIDCEHGTPKEQMSIAKIVQEMSQQALESVPQHLTSKWRIPEYISKKRVNAFFEKCREIGAIPSRNHTSDNFSPLPYGMSFTEMWGDDK